MEDAMNRSRADIMRLTLLCAAQFMLILDVVVVNVALPSIRADLSIPDSRLSLVGIAYTLTFGSLLIVAGHAGDLFGRRRLLIGGLTLFSVASLATGMADSQWLLFAGRALQGVGAAMVSPTAMALVLHTFAEGERRNWALGIWGAVGSAGAISGQLVGGALTDAFGWRSVFLVNVPVGILVIVAVAALVGESVDRGSRDLDVVGAVLLTGALVSLTAVLVQLAESAPNGITAALVVLAGGGLALFVRTERRHPHPLLRLGLLRQRPVRAGNIVLALNAAAVTAALFFTTLYLQVIVGMGPLDVGLAFAPVTLTVLVVSPQAAKLVSRFGVRPTLLAGAALGVAGLLYLTRIPEAGGGYLRDVLPGLMLLALGNGLSYAPTFIAGTSGVLDSEHGTASGLLSTAQELGAALGLGVLALLASTGGAAADARVLTAGYRAGFGWTAGLMVLTALVAARVPREIGVASASVADESNDAAPADTR
jgi:EmrB/QacA subfamily drug resistance transporter